MSAADLEKLRELLDATALPPCAELTTFELLDADAARGFVRVEFDPQPAFGNHFGNIQGGFVVGMLDPPLSLAAFLLTGEWLPTVEVKTSFIAPAPIARNIAEAVVLRAGKRMVFVEARLFAPDRTLVTHATATCLRSPD